MLRPGIVLLLGLSACAHTSTADEVEPYFLTVEHGDAAQAMAAGEKLAAAYDDAHLPRLEKTLAAKPVRAIQLIGDLSSDGSARLLLNHLPYFLESKDPEVARMAAVVAGLRRLKPATAALLHHPEEPAVVRALGRIWEQDLDSQPLPREEEIDRLTVFAVVHRQAMGPNPSVEACEAMLSVMTAAELADFLAKHAADKFPARRHCDEAVRRPDFDADKGQRVHEALLRSPDVNLVSGILESSPFPLEESLVQALLKDDRTVKEGVRVGDVAARRLKR
jgi:hypothetical protein